MEAACILAVVFGLLWWVFLLLGRLEAAVGALEAEREYADTLGHELARRDSGGCQTCADRADFAARARLEAQEIIATLEGGWV